MHVQLAKPACTVRSTPLNHKKAQLSGYSDTACHHCAARNTLSGTQTCERTREPERALLLVWILGSANVCAHCSTRGKGAGCLLRQKWVTWRHTGWRRLIGSPKLQIIFHKRATKYGSLLWKMTCKDKGSYESSPPCNMPALDFMSWALSLSVPRHTLKGPKCVHLQARTRK